MSLSQFLGGSITWILAAETGMIALLGFGYARQSRKVQNLNDHLVAMEAEKNNEISGLKSEIIELKVEKKRLIALKNEADVKHARVARALTNSEKELEEVKKTSQKVAVRTVYVDSSDSSDSDSSSSSDEYSRYQQKQRDAELCRQSNQRCLAGCEGLSTKGIYGSDKGACQSKCRVFCGW